MVEDLLPDVPKSSIGKYSGAIESLFSLSSVCFMYQWGRLSDRIGRKPVILSGLFGVSSTLVRFGLSRNFYWALLARALSEWIQGWRFEVCPDNVRTNRRRSLRQCEQASPPLLSLR